MLQVIEYVINNNQTRKARKKEILKLQFTLHREKI